MITDRMQINHANEELLPDYGSLYLVKFNGSTHVNDYGGNDTDDVAKLNLITNAAPGSTCLFSNGDIYRLELDGWAKFGAEETAQTSNSASPASLNLTPLKVGRDELINETDLNDIEETPEELAVEPIINNEDII